ncbi:MAG: undecaprenyl-diphosphate phosphatase [Kiritimatiellae bacterium]|nr:undecaprenyl-diphosphate phosphatase [Kiritimatiellia bacterium]
MDWTAIGQASALGLVQGLTEYLPVSSSGHLAIGAHFFGLSGEENLAFTVAVHAATVLSTLVVLWREIAWIVADLFRFKWNAGTRYAVAILVSMIPVAVVGVCFRDAVEASFGAGLRPVGACLLATAALLAFAHFAKPRNRDEITMGHAFAIGVAQAAAVLPGLSRSGATISAGLLLGDKKERVAEFSFLMVIPPILGEALLDIAKAFGGAEEAAEAAGGMPFAALAIGFLVAFVSGCAACKWMIALVKRGKLSWFALYCALVGVALLVAG